ncbi:hypothetical protein C8F01DRAFT_1149237 [Mycena amicta]|nr:hypothetical protein C8F01DRAFT_1149237 [Mycena amicta]
MADFSRPAAARALASVAPYTGPYSLVVVPCAVPVPSSAHPTNDNHDVAASACLQLDFDSTDHSEAIGWLCLGKVGAASHSYGRICRVMDWEDSLIDKDILPRTAGQQRADWHARRGSTCKCAVCFLSKHADACVGHMETYEDNSLVVTLFLAGPGAS